MRWRSLDESNIVDYLIHRGLVDASTRLRVNELSGGFINSVWRVTTANGDLVIKQSYETSERAVLQADVRRALVEATAMKAINGWLADSPVPRVIDDDPDNFVIVMEAAPADAVLYEDELQAGRVPAGVAEQIGRYAANLHAATGDLGAAGATFRSNPGFALRAQSIRGAAAASPDLAEHIERVLARNSENPRCLVDYDITPKNVLVHDGAITKLDFECVQLGDPAFDLGILLAHYALLAFARPELTTTLLQQMDASYGAYSTVREEAATPAFAASTSEYLAVMMLGRVDSEFTFDYALPHRSMVRQLARRLLSEPSRSLQETLGLLHEMLPNPSTSASDQWQPLAPRD